MVESSPLAPLHAWLVIRSTVKCTMQSSAFAALPMCSMWPSCLTCTSPGTSASVVAIGTTHLIYPQAVGGDIGCGVLAVPFDVSADRLAEPAIAGRVLAKLAGAVPARRWNRKMTMEPPHDVASDTRSDPRLDVVWRKQGYARTRNTRQWQPLC